MNIKLIIILGFDFIMGQILSCCRRRPVQSNTPNVAIHTSICESQQALSLTSNPINDTQTSSLIRCSGQSCSGKLTEENLRSIICGAWEFRANWRIIGLKLGVDQGTLDAIERSNHHRVDDCFTKMIVTWLRSHEATQDKLKEALSVDVMEGMIDKSRSSYSRCREQLATTYHQQLYDEADNFLLPRNTVELVNLKLIKDIGSEDRHKEAIKSVDDVIGNKEELTYENIFKSETHQSFILIIGRPGSGKTTLMSRISIDWAEKEIIPSEILFLVHLRKLNLESDRSLATIITTTCPNLEFHEDLLQFLVDSIKKSDGHGFTFALDGLDEYVPVKQRKHKDFIFQLMKGKVLPQSVVIVTSRPAASEEVYRYADKKIEVIGFENPQIHDYIYSYFQNNTKKAQKLIQHLEEHVNLLNACYLPIQCAMLSFIFDEDDTNLPATDTEFYKYFTIAALLRCFHKDGSTKMHIEDFSQLPLEYKCLLDKICELAFNATSLSKQIFKCTELVKGGLTALASDGKASTDKDGLGLVVINCYISRYGHDETYTFLHLTFQEYLSALYLNELSPLEQLDCITTHFRDKKQPLEVVCRFLCGMMKFSSTDSMRIFDAIISRPTWMRSLYGILCAYETQNQQACTHVLKRLKGRLIITDENMSVSPSDCAAISYVVRESTFHLQELELSRCNIGPEGARNLAHGLSSCFKLLKLEISHNSLGAKGAAAILSSIENLSVLQKLSLSGNSIGPEGAVAIAPSLEILSNLQELVLGKNELGEGVASIACSLRKMSNLKVLSLDDNSIGPKETVAIAEALVNLTNLENLNLTGNCIGPEGSVELAPALKKLINLQKLSLVGSRMGDKGAAAIAPVLKGLTNLQELHLYGASVSVSGRDIILQAVGTIRVTGLRNINMK